MNECLVHIGPGESNRVIGYEMLLISLFQLIEFLRKHAVCCRFPQIHMSHLQIPRHAGRSARCRLGRCRPG